MFFNKTIKYIKKKKKKKKIKKKKKKKKKQIMGLNLIYYQFNLFFENSGIIKIKQIKI